MRFVLVILLVTGCVAFSQVQSNVSNADNTAADNRVKVTGGLIEGITQKNGVRAFKGIPFANPPVGDLRWKAPQPVKPWEGVRQAKEFGPSPMQDGIVAWLGAAKPSEDCLYLNVWTP